MTSKQIIFAGVFVVLFTACGDFGRGGFEPEPGDGAPGDVTEPTNGGAGFAPVHAILQARCGQCHGSGSATAFRLTGDADQDHGIAAGLVETANPAESRLLAKGAGETAHGGGAVLDAGGTEYQTILNWITEGAPR